jgi:hypothetical protein
MEWQYQGVIGRTGLSGGFSSDAGNTIVSAEIATLLAEIPGGAREYQPSCTGNPRRGPGQAGQGTSHFASASQRLWPVTRSSGLDRASWVIGHARAEMLGGAVRIQSTTGQETTVIASSPVDALASEMLNPYSSLS